MGIYKTEQILRVWASSEGRWGIQSVKNVKLLRLQSSKYLQINQSGSDHTKKVKPRKLQGISLVPLLNIRWVIEFLSRISPGNTYWNETRIGNCNWNRQGINSPIQYYLYSRSLDLKHKLCALSNIFYDNYKESCFKGNVL